MESVTQSTTQPTRHTNAHRGKKFVPTMATESGPVPELLCGNEFAD
jgi:hypothetical protein